MKSKSSRFVLHILSYHDSPLVKLIIILLFYVYFVVTRTDLLVVVYFTAWLGVKMGYGCSYVYV